MVDVSNSKLISNMKRSVYLIILASIALLATACEPDDFDLGPATKPDYRVKSFDGYSFAYNENGTIASVTLLGVRQDFTWNDKTLLIGKGDAAEYTLTLNKQGYATKIETSQHTWTMDYDKSGFLTKGSLDGVQVTGQTISSSNITCWTSYDRLKLDWRKNEATYLPKVNVGWIKTHWAEALGLERWMFEAGLLGRASANLVESSCWRDTEGALDTNTSVYDYEYDVNGCVTKELRYYGKWNEFDVEGLSLKESHTFTWEKN